MQPSIPFGIILQNRYRIIKILGQGGFGRTYLAEDQGRFNELCAIKELIPVQTENYTLEKSKELFQREANILYQIQHPQVPQFRATFEQDQRLFLVQDYVEGKTYRTLLEERRGAGQTFSEIEVLRLLRQLLPVLAHLHSRGIIHRDISPENIILRESDDKPVLIDFGVVKELATKLRSPNQKFQPTTVGKFGYAPSEQIQTGRAYPNSDLYALAVTAVVLLTGREAQELFDDNQLNWNWEHLVNVSPEFAQVLNRMLSYKPSDRYQSVAQVVQALQAFNHQTNLQLPTINRQSKTGELSQIKTVAVNRRPDLIQPSNSLNRPDPVIPAPKTREIWEKPWAIASLAIFVAIAAGIGSWAVVTALLRNQSAPQTFPSPLVSETPTSTPAPFETPNEPVSYSQNVNLPTGETFRLEGSLKANSTVNYTFNGEQGQQLSAILAEEGILLSVLGPNQALVDNRAQRVTQYQGTLPFTGVYTVQLSPVQGVTEGNYKLDLRLDNPVTPTPTQSPDAPTPSESTPTPSVEVPTVDAEPINFNPGETEKQVLGQTSPQQPKRYLVNVQPGQELSVAAERGVVTLALLDPSGERVPRACSYLVCKVQLPEGGEYQIQVIPNQEKESNFTLNVRLRNLE